MHSKGMAVLFWSAFLTFIPVRMLQAARMADLVKLRCGVDTIDEDRQWAAHSIGGVRLPWLCKSRYLRFAALGADRSIS